MNYKIWSFGKRKEYHNGTSSSSVWWNLTQTKICTASFGWNEFQANEFDEMLASYIQTIIWPFTVWVLFNYQNSISSLYLFSKRWVESVEELREFNTNLKLTDQFWVKDEALGGENPRFRKLAQEHFAAYEANKNGRTSF